MLLWKLPQVKPTPLAGEMEKGKEKAQLPLHALHVNKLTTAVNRAHILLHSFLVTLFLYYRLDLLFTQNDAVPASQPPLLPCLLLLGAELILCFLWLCEQGFRWRPVNRTAFVHRLPEDSRLPAVDVLVFTADPDKEPTVEVMNTVVSAMALDYPIDKLHVYLSDDSGSPGTLAAVVEAWAFATWWVPFCRRYGLKCRSPMAYFDGKEQDQINDDDEFIKYRSLLKEKFEVFKQRVKMNLLRPTENYNKANHPPLIQVINDNCTDSSIINPDYSGIPLLVYVAREKRPSHPHHFKAGALNVLLRVSGLLSNSPITLVLDCDMYCNDPTSAKQAMCFYLDRDISPSLAFVQFPQRYHNLRSNDVYDNGLRWAFKVLMQGLDGLNTGPLMCGSGFYLNRKAIYSPSVKGLGMDPVVLRNKFGPSNEFVKTLTQSLCKPGEIDTRQVSHKNLQEAEFVASCAYEEDTKWGEGVGFYYYSIAEDVFAGYHLLIGGWKSVYIDPQIAPFLGTATTNFNVFMTQNTRWTAGLVEIGMSRFCPLIYGPSRRHLALVHRLYYTWVVLYPINFVPVWIMAIIPQLCLLHGIPIYCKVSTPLFPLLALLIFVSSLLKHLHEVVRTGGTVLTWWNEQRTWTLKMLTCNTYGCSDAIMKAMGLKETSFIPTSKVTDEEQDKRYEQGVYDFRTSNRFLVPLGTAVILNLVCFVGGLVRVTVVGNWDEMLAQLVLSAFFVAMSKAIVEGMVVRKDNGRFPTSATLMSIVVCSVVLVLGPFILLH
ncbi:hypothetical protein V2J09_015815 [Rumex salicifolius]